MWTTCGFVLHNVHVPNHIILCCLSLRGRMGIFLKNFSQFYQFKQVSLMIIYRPLFESSARKMIHCPKLFTTTVKSYILFEILWRLTRCSYAIYSTALFIKGAPTKSLHQASHILACHGSSGDGGWVKKIYNKNLC